MIRTRRDPAWVGDNVYNLSGVTQAWELESDFLPPLYELRVQNDGDKPDRFRITGPGDAGVWRMAYYDHLETGIHGGKNVTAAVAGDNGFLTPLLQPGQDFTFRMDTIPTSMTPGGATKITLVKVTSVNDPDVVDVVRAVTNQKERYEVEIRRHNFDDSGVYRAFIDNRGNITQRFRLRGPFQAVGWKARYFDAYNGGNDITEQVTSDGWLTPALGIKERQEFRVEFTRANPDVRPRALISVQSAQHSSGQDDTWFEQVDPPAPSAPFFMIGVWSQPTYNFGGWVDRGVNTLMKWEPLGGAVSNETWSAEARARGLYMIREPSSDPAADAQDPYLLAWMHHDEPDIYRDHLPQIENDYKTLKAKYPHMQFGGNLTGAQAIGWHPTNIHTREGYQEILKSYDWPATALYPISGWNQLDQLDGPARAVDRFEKWTNGKPQIAIIEPADHELPWMPEGVRGPTRAEFRAELWLSVIAGAHGVFYFPQAIEPFRFDNMSPELVLEMKLQNARLKEVSEVLVSPRDPSNMGIDFKQPFEVTWRRQGGKLYYVVFNHSDKPVADASFKLYNIGNGTKARVVGEDRTITLTDNNEIVDNFGAYGVRIYEVDPTPGNAAAAARAVEPAEEPQRASFEPALFSANEITFEEEEEEDEYAL
jgi:hypothetical protein